MKKITQSESMWLWVFGKLLQHFFFFLKRKHISLKLTRRVIQRACEAGQRKQFTAQIRMQKRQYKGRGNALPNLGRKSNKLNYKKSKQIWRKIHKFIFQTRSHQVTATSPSKHSTTRPDLINLEWVTIRPYLLGEDPDPWSDKSINSVELDLCWTWRVEFVNPGWTWRVKCFEF